MHLGDALLAQQAGVLGQVLQGRRRHAQQHGLVGGPGGGDGDAAAVATCLALAPRASAEDVVRAGGARLGLRRGGSGIGAHAVVAETIRLGVGRALLVALGVVHLAQVGVGLEQHQVDIGCRDQLAIGVRELELGAHAVPGDAELLALDVQDREAAADVSGKGGQGPAALGLELGQVGGDFGGGEGNQSTHGVPLVNV